MHDEGELVSVRVLLSTGYEFTFIEGDEPCLDGKSLGVFKDKSTSVDCDTLEDRGVLVDHEGCSGWDDDEVIGDGRNVDSPCGGITPS